MNRITEEELESLRQDSIYERFIAGSDVRKLIAEIRSLRSLLEEEKK